MLWAVRRSTTTVVRGAALWVVAVLLGLASSHSSHAQAGFGWAPGFGRPPGGVNDLVLATAVFNSGTGPALYAGGLFTTAGGVAANRIAKWDGQNWTALGDGANDAVRALAVFDDGTGPALYAGGLFTTAGGVAANRIAKWDGTQWASLGTGIDSFVLALAVFDDGRGPALYAGGDFITAGGRPSLYVGKWALLGAGP